MAIMHVFAKAALLPTGWGKNIGVSIDSKGFISDVVVDDREKADVMVDVLLPAPANLHSHSFQRAMAGLTEKANPYKSDSFWSWRKLMYRFLDQLSPEDIESIAALVQMEMLKSGYCCNVEFHYLHHQAGGIPYSKIHELSSRIIAAADQSGIGLTLVPVLYQQGGCDGRNLTKGQIRFGNNLDSFVRLLEGAEKCLKENLPHDAILGTAAHSLRAVSKENIQTLQTVSTGPIHMHIAEQPGEVEEVFTNFGARPIEWLMNNVEINSRWCLIHCTQMTNNEAISLAKTGAVAGLCPITESSLGDGIFNGKIFTGAGGLFGIGSDSNIRISLSEELRTLEYSQRLRDKSRAILSDTTKSTGRWIYENVCLGGSKAAARKTGNISRGFLADLVAIDHSAISLIGRQEDAIIDSWIFASDDRVVTDVWSAGRHMVKEGIHINERNIITRYRKTIARIEDLL